MRRSNWSAVVAPLAAATLAMGLAACDQTQDTTTEADALPLYTAPPTESMFPGEGEKDNAASGAGEANSNRPAQASPAGRQPDRPATAPMRAPSPAAARAPTDAQPTQAADPHEGHDMPSMSDHDMDGM